MGLTPLFRLTPHSTKAKTRLYCDTLRNNPRANGPVMQQDLAKLVKVTLTLDESKGLYFLTSPGEQGVFIAVTSPDDIRRAVDVCLRNLYEQDGQQVRVYMNCQLIGPTIDAVVELL